ncbi:MAG: hypothetical protein RL538_900 [Candidatus Parcubacteria bacterium]|jgi:hypothetical protein
MVITEAEQYPIFARIDALRMHAFEAPTLELQDELDVGIIALDQELQREIAERFGDGNLRRYVPEWHKLVGSTPERHDVADEIRDLVTGKVARFVEEQEQKWGL